LCGESARYPGLGPEGRSVAGAVPGGADRQQCLCRSRRRQARAVRRREQGQQARRLPLTGAFSGKVGTVFRRKCDQLRSFPWGVDFMVERRGAAVGIAGLRKEYLSGPGRVLALDDVDLRIAPGEFVCIVGPSGCGKSTLLRILAGLDTQSGGSIKVEALGWAVQNAMVFQESGLFPWMSVEANVG